MRSEQNTSEQSKKHQVEAAVSNAHNLPQTLYDGNPPQVRCTIVTSLVINFSPQPFDTPTRRNIPYPQRLS